MSGQTGSLPPIRIVLVAFAGLLRDIVWQTLEAESDMRVVAELVDYESVDRFLGRASADLLIWSANGDGGDGVYADVLDQHPRLKVLAIRDDGRRGCLWELRPFPTSLGEVSPRLLVTAIREAVSQ
jgi:DNA-binding NarL/FixJ family response regulator